MKKFTRLLILALLLSGCAKDPKPVEFYKKNETERKVLLDKFKANPGKYKDEGDVINAVQAETQLQNEHFFSYKPAKVTAKGAGAFQLK